MNGLDRAIAAAGGVGALAARLGIFQSAVSNWRKRKKVPAERCREIERITGVPAGDLRPDVFGPLQRKKAA